MNERANERKNLLQIRHKRIPILPLSLPTHLNPQPPNPKNIRISHPQHRTIEIPHQPLNMFETAFEQDVLAGGVGAVGHGFDVVESLRGRSGTGGGGGEGGHVGEKGWDECLEGFGCVAFSSVGWEGKGLVGFGFGVWFGRVAFDRIGRIDGSMRG